jgi:hypothetical protein
MAAEKRKHRKYASLSISDFVLLGAFCAFLPQFCNRLSEFDGGTSATVFSDCW